MSKTIQAKVVVLGSGPGGYSAAFRAADLLGEGVVLVERYPILGGVCLNVGCIPSKALLHLAEIKREAQVLSSHGIEFGSAKINVEKIREYKNKVVKRLTSGLSQMAKMRKVEIVTGFGTFNSSHELLVKGEEEISIQFENAIIAAGSSPIKLPFLPDDSRIMDSTGALDLENIPERLLVIGGGIIGMEMATVYSALGSKVTIVELTDSLLPGVDKDIVTPLFKRFKPECENILLKTKVTKAEAQKEGIYVTFEGEGTSAKPERFDKVLAAVGRAPNGKMLQVEKAGVHLDDKGFIPVDTQQRTNVAHIFAIGDIVGQPMLAHKAMPEGRVAAEVIAGKKHFFAPKCIPNVAYTDPEVAWVGITENEAKEKQISYETGIFPWIASGRSLSMGRDEGITKLLFDKETHKVLGGAIVGPRAGDLISEVGLAIEMGCEAEDVALTIHPHPTVAETIALACEVFEGTITDLPNKKKK